MKTLLPVPTLLLIAVVATTALAESPPIFLLEWGSGGTGDGQFNFPTDVAVDGDGNVFVSDLENSRIQKFTSEGEFLGKWHLIDTYAWPIGVAVDASGNVYVADRESHRIEKYTGNGALITSWNGFGSELAGVAVVGDNHVYVSDSGVSKFTSNGEFITAWGQGGLGSEDGQFGDASPKGIAVDSGGDVYTADWGNYRIQKFTSAGEFLMKWGEPGLGDGQFSGRPIGLAVDMQDNVYITEMYGGHRVQKFSSDGTFVTKWGEEGAGGGQFSNPFGIAVSATGAIFVADTGNNRIQKFAYPSVQAECRTWGRVKAERR